MGNSRFLATGRYAARLSIQLLIGVSLLSGLPAVAQTVSQSSEPVLIAQRTTLLREGDRGPAVSALQRQLGNRGLFSAASVNGIYGSSTTQAVRQFQRIRRLPVTGIADAETLEQLGVDLASLPVGLSHPIHGTISSDRITRNSSRDDVRVLQRVLRSFGFNLTDDGVYGAQTEQAIRTYERTADLPVDGVADRATLLDMGFTDGGGRDPRLQTADSSRSSRGRYVAAIIAGPSELGTVQQDFPNATVERNNLGQYISLGRFFDQSDAAAWVDLADELGYEARVLRD
ncbi:MAG: peptidoglycan-binding protein [Cyanobacteria bacterium P01_H01_bin.21]